MMSKVRTAMSVCAALLAAVVFGNLVAAPVQETRGGVSILHGGIGASDRAAIEQKAADYNLKLTFARQGSGAFLSGVKVVVRDRRGAVVIDTVASGPLLLARLPEGEYRVAATERAATLKQNVTILGKAPRALVFRFDLPKGVEPEFDTGRR
jgi:hypothetical protein